MVPKIFKIISVIMIFTVISFYSNKQFELYIEDFFEKVPQQTQLNPLYLKFQEKIKIIQDDVEFQDFQKLLYNNFIEFQEIMKGKLDEYQQKFIKLFIQRKKQNIDKYKYYHNFASQYGGATIVDKNTNSQNTKSLLSDNKDQYMLNKCTEDNKFVTIMLKEDVTVESFSIINSEFYSSNVKDIEVYGSQSFPTEEWITLGRYQATDDNIWQFFDLKSAWVRFIKFKFKSYYGSEYYCPITQIKVFGSTILQDLQLEVNQQLNTKQNKEISNNNKNKNSSNNNTNIQNQTQNNNNNQSKQENNSNSKNNNNTNNINESELELQSLNSNKKENNIKFQKEIIYETSEEEEDSEQYLIDEEVNTFKQIQEERCKQSWNQQTVNWYGDSVQNELQESINNYETFCQRYNNNYYTIYQEKQDVIDEQYEKIEKQCLYMDMKRYFIRKLNKQCVPVELTFSEIENEQKQKDIKQQSILKTLSQHIKQLEGYQNEYQQNQIKYQEDIKLLLDKVSLEKENQKKLAKQNFEQLEIIQSQNSTIQILNSKIEEQFKNQKIQSQENAILMIVVAIITIIVLFLMGIFIYLIFNNQNLEHSLDSIRQSLRRMPKKRIYQQEIIQQDKNFQQ